MKKDKFEQLAEAITQKVLKSCEMTGLMLQLTGDQRDTVDIAERIVANILSHIMNSNGKNSLLYTMERLGAIDETHDKWEIHFHWNYRDSGMTAEQLLDRPRDRKPKGNGNGR